MTVTAFPQLGSEVYAAEQPSVSQFATTEELTTFNTNDNDGEVNSAKIYFGENGSGSAQEWWIVGKDNSGDDLVMFAASPLTSAMFNSSINDKTYDGDIVYANHYGASDLFNTLKTLETNTAYFSTAEQDLMMDTTVYTEDKKNGGSYSTTGKLYAAYGDYDDNQHVIAGTNSSSSLNGGLRIDMSYWENGTFWLRTPYPKGNNSFSALIGYRGLKVAFDTVYYSHSVVPAFQLNLPSVLFGSTVPAASSDGQQNRNNAMTLRYQSQSSVGTANISGSKQSVVITDITDENIYLVVQNSEGAWAKKVTDNDLIFANEMSDILTSFENCKVWLETTDSSERITYATMATQGNGHNIKINIGDTMTVSTGNEIQTDVTGRIDEIVIKAKDGYMFPADYTVAEQNGIKVTRDNENQITVSGTPAADVTLTLPEATKKVYDMNLSGDGTFGTICEGYEPVIVNEFTITNNGNVDLENVKASVTGTDADKFELEWDNTSTINPSGTIKVTVKPKDDLAAGTYQATLSVSADYANTVTINLQFIVSEHDYDTFVTPPTCTEKGYTTYTCKNCNHSYTGDETDATGHDFGEWEIIQSPTCEQSGTKKHTCKECQFTETKDLDPNGHEWETDYTVDKEATCTEDGSKSIHCKNCDAVKDSEVMPKSGHSFTNYVSNNDAACTQDGTDS